MSFQLNLSIAACFLFAIFTSANAMEEIKVKPIAVSDNIHMLVGKGGNIGVLTGSDGTFVIDDQFAPLTEKIISAIKSIGGDTPRFLVNTHFHGDHTGGNENLGKKGTLIAAHDNVRIRLTNGSFISAFGMKSPPADEAALPVLTYSQDMHFHINNETVHVIHIANAHTDGDSIVHFKNANVIHAGDTFFNGFYPFIDAAHGGSLKGMINAAEQIIALSDDNTKIIPGHGPLTNKDQLQVYRDMLNTAYTRLLDLKNQGFSVDEVVNQKPLKDLESKWGNGIFTGDRWIQIVYPGVR